MEKTFGEKRIDESGAKEIGDSLREPVATYGTNVDKPLTERTFEEKLDELSRVVNRHPLNREAMHDVLKHCRTERSLNEIEREMALLPSCKQATQNPYRLICFLEKACGLELIERDSHGDRVLPQDKEGLDDDAIDDLVATFGYLITDVGRAFLTENDPAKRLGDLVRLTPERKETYVEMLEFIHEKKRSYVEVEKLLAERPILYAMIDGRRQVMQASVFVDKLERCGLLFWDKGWNLSAAGKSALQDFRPAPETI